MPDVVERVRVLVEGTGLSQKDIAARTGVHGGTVGKWARKRGWTRPAEAPRFTWPIAAERAGLGARLRAGFARLAAFADREAERLVSEANRERARRTRALAVVARRAEAQLARAADRDLPRMMRPPPRRRDRPRADALFGEARDLVERTTLRMSDIARRLGVARKTVALWTQEGGWIRPLDAPGPLGGWTTGPGWRGRMEGRIDARRRLDEAERLLDALGPAESVGLDRIAPVFRALEGVRFALRPAPASLKGSGHPPGGARTLARG